MSPAPWFWLARARAPARPRRALLRTSFAPRVELFQATRSRRRPRRELVKRTSLCGTTCAWRSRTSQVSSGGSRRFLETVGISISSLYQPEVSAENVAGRASYDDRVPIVVVTQKAREETLRSALAQLRGSGILSEDPMRIRIED